jgi:hypothetical protein
VKAGVGERGRLALHRLDLGEPSSVAELFTVDGVWR